MANSETFPLAARIGQGNDLRRKVESNAQFEGRKEWLGFPPVLPDPVASLVQSLQSDGVPPELLTDALQLIAFFAQGCRTKDGWRALSTGPHGQELLHQAWLLYEPMQWPEDTWLKNTCAVIAAYRRDAKIKEQIGSSNREDAGCALLACAGTLWIASGNCVDAANAMPLEDVETRIFLEDPALCEAAVWAWASIHRERQTSPQPQPEVLDRLLSIWLGDTVAKRTSGTAAYALSQHMGLRRDAWTPALTTPRIDLVRTAAAPVAGDPDAQIGLRAALMVAFHARSVWPDEELAPLLSSLAKDRRMYIRGWEEDRARLALMLDQLNAMRP